MKSFLRLFLFLAIVVIFTGQLCAQQRIDKRQPKYTKTSESKTTPAKAHQKTSGTYTYKIINLAESTFGYDILINDKVTIHQTTIPGRSGIKGFTTKEDASKVAELVIQKLKEGQMPPTITSQELNKIIQIN